MTALRAEFEQRFSKVLRSRAATAPRGAMRALDPHPERRPEQDGRSPSRHRRRDLSPGSEHLSRRPGPLGQQLEVHHAAQPGRGAKLASRPTENGPGQPPVDTIRKGEDHASAIVRGSYRNVCHRCPYGSTGADPGPLEQLPAENTARLTTPPARTGRHRFGATARSTGRSTPIPALCRPPTSHWRAGARVDVGRPHQRLEQPSRGNSPTPGPAPRFLWCGCRSLAGLPPLSALQEGNHS